MSLLSKVKESVLGLKGGTPSKMPGALKTSTLHNNSSITDKPDILAQQSQLSLKGKKPANNYLDNLPEKGIKARAIDGTGSNSTDRS
jgi:hypothetical protein|tara:strand:- start:393 stop:653 length:261 start_codon:yes stop_codon:yes gene_type:complete